MSLLNKASLIQIPSGYKDGTLYSAKPTNGDGDFTFSRGSNLAATRVNSEGLIEKGRENLLLQSNTFDTTWTTTNASVTGGQSGYDGTNDAWLLQNNAGYTSAVVKQNFSLGSAVRSSSVYAKSGNVNWLLLLVYDGANSYVSWFNLTDGSTANESNIIDAKSTSVGGGWYRCEISANTNITNLNIYPTAVAGSTLTDDGDYIYIQDAQLELGLVATDYIETTTTTEQAGILEDMPRLDYSGGASCPSLLLEPQRSNLYTNSEYYDGYNQANLTISTNATTSPEGLQNASKLVSSSGSNIKRIQPSITTSSATDYIISAFVKKAEWDYFFIYGDGTLSSGQNAIWDLENGTITQGSGHSTIESFGQGWYKITWKATASGAGSAAPRIGITDNSTGVNSNGDGTSGVFLYGLQMEEGSYPTSYIPTYGSSVTRSADSCSKTGISSLIGQTEGTLFCDFVFNGKSDLLTDNFNLTLGTWASDVITIGQYNETLYARIYASSVIYFNQDFGVMTIGQRYKCAVAYANNDAVFYVNGSLMGSDTSVVVPATSSISLNRGGYENSKQINQALLFPTRLTNDELASLTTI